MTGAARPVGGASEGSESAPGMMSTARANALAAVGAFMDARVLALAALGFSAGLPLLLIFGTLGLWLREAGFERGAVTYFSWAALGYSFKFVWAPLVDKLPLPLLARLLGQRRAWMLTAQLAVIGALALMANTDPAHAGLAAMAVGAVALGFSSATQDIVIDAYRIEIADESMQALLSSAYVAGYRAGMIVAGAGALYLAAALGTTVDQYVYAAWKWTYLGMAAAMLVGVATTLLAREPARRGAAKYRHSAWDYARFLLMFAATVAAFANVLMWLPDSLARACAALSVSCEAAGSGALAAFGWNAARFLVALAVALAVARLLVAARAVGKEMLRDTYVAPVVDFFARYGRGALIVLLLVGFYRVSDIVLGVVANIFYLDMGYDKETIATATKAFGVAMTIFGGFLGGWLAIWYGTMRVLMLGAALTVATNLLFVWLAQTPGDVAILYVVVSADNLTAGLATAAFVAYLSSLTSLSFTAMQYAIFSSMMTLFPKLLGGYSGTVVDAFGYTSFFFGAALIGVPVLVLVALAARQGGDAEAGRRATS